MASVDKPSLGGYTHPPRFPHSERGMGRQQDSMQLSPMNPLIVTRTLCDGEVFWGIEPFLLLDSGDGGVVQSCR